MARLLNRANSVSSSSVFRITDRDHNGKTAGWDGMIRWGDEFQQRTGITPKDVDRVIKEVRRERHD